MNNTKLEAKISQLAETAILKEMMNLEVAVKLIEAVENKAKEMGLAVVVAVSNAAGRPIAVHCMDVFSLTKTYCWTLWITINSGKFLKRWEYQIT